VEETQVENFPKVKIEDEIQGAYLEYAMSVIIGRALPDVRDGLKPVHRRILWAMSELGNTPEKKYLKSARIVGDVIGKYHPHGDAPVYGAMVRMAQDFAQRYTLVDGQGNFGSIDGDNAAAMRYTEARMSKIGHMLLKDIERQTVDFGTNYDGSLKEPKVLPSVIPNLFVNGSSGIAVGMSTNIPPHNLGEILNALLKIIDEPTVELEELMEIVPGPDMPTRGIITRVGGIKNAYRHGKGTFHIKGRVEIEERKKEREAIIVTELPYQVNKANWITHVATLVRDKVLTGISDIRDESNRKGIRIVLELKRGEQSQVILNTLYSKTQLRTSFGMNLLAIENGRPRLFNLKEYLHSFLGHRKDVVTRRCVYELNKAEARAHILEGLKIALDNIDKVVELIKKASNTADAKEKLAKAFSFSDKQCQAILDMRLQKLTALETDKLLEELKTVLAEIDHLKIILGSEVELLKVVRAEFCEILEKFNDERQSEISLEDEKDFNVEDFVRKEQVVVTVSNHGYAKRSTVETYRAQGRGGKGVKGAGTGASDDFVEHLFVSNTHSYILCFSDKGRIHWLKVHQIPEMSRTARGRPLVQLLQLAKDEKIQSLLSVAEFKEGQFIFMATKNGTVKKTDLMSFSRVRQGGIIALSINEGDELIGAALTNGDDSVFMATKKGQSVRFNEGDVRAMGRTARGVRGINLKADDEVVAMEVLDKGESEKITLLTISSRGYGKKTKVEEYRLQSRGGSGIINLKTSDKVGEVVSVAKVDDACDLMVISDGGKMIRTPSKNISVFGRATQGVRILNLNEGESVQALAIVREEEGDEEE